MDPNSRHQLWSRWVVEVTLPFHIVHATKQFATEVREGCAYFYREMFGSATELHINAIYIPSTRQTHITVTCRTEGAPMPDPVFRQLRIDQLAQFFGNNLRKYGEVKVHVEVHLEAGDTGDGKPPAQLIIGPPVALMPRTRLMGQ